MDSDPAGTKLERGMLMERVYEIIPMRRPGEEGSAVFGAAAMEALKRNGGSLLRKPDMEGERRVRRRREREGDEPGDEPGDRGDHFSRLPSEVRRYMGAWIGGARDIRNLALASRDGLDAVAPARDALIARVAAASWDGGVRALAGVLGQAALLAAHGWSIRMTVLREETERWGAVTSCSYVSVRVSSRWPLGRCMERGAVYVETTTSLSVQQADVRALRAIEYLVSRLAGEEGQEPPRWGSAPGDPLHAMALAGWRVHSLMASYAPWDRCPAGMVQARVSPLAVYVNAHLKGEEEEQDARRLRDLAALLDEESSRPLLAMGSLLAPCGSLLAARVDGALRRHASHHPWLQQQPSELALVHRYVDWRTDKPMRVYELAVLDSAVPVPGA